MSESLIGEVSSSASHEEEGAQGIAAVAHPEPLEIERFIRGKTRPSANTAIVLHLLRGCPECQRVARAVWYRTGSAIGRFALIGQK